MKKLVGMILLMAMGLSVAAPIKSIVGGKHCGMSGAKLPYDAEVEYLAQSVVGSYIDTGIVGDQNVDMVATCRFLVSPGNYGGAIFGSRQTYSLNAYMSTYSLAGVGFSFGTYTPNVSVSVDTNYHTYSIIGGDCAFDGQLIHTFGSVSFVTPTYLWLFKAYNSPYDQIKAISSCKIWREGVLVRDMIPVRFTNELDQSEGAMYDRVSGQLFRNAGTGAFIFGPDK